MGLVHHGMCTTGLLTGDMSSVVTLLDSSNLAYSRPVTCSGRRGNHGPLSALVDGVTVTDHRAIPLLLLDLSPPVLWFCIELDDVYLIGWVRNYARGDDDRKYDENIEPPSTGEIEWALEKIVKWLDIYDATTLLWRHFNITIVYPFDTPLWFDIKPCVWITKKCTDYNWCDFNTANKRGNYFRFNLSEVEWCIYISVK